MLSEYFKSPSHIRALQNGPYGSRIEGFAAHLSQIGYSKESACQHIRSAELVILWADHMRLCLADIDKAGLQRFGDHLVRRRGGTYCRHKRVNILAGARLFLQFLHGCDRDEVCRRPTDGDLGLWSTFCKWMTAQRGTCEATLRNYEKPLSKLIRAIGEDARLLDALLLRRFVTEETRDVGWVAAKHCTSALRMFVRFLAAKSLCSVSLLGAIPSVAHWRLASLPRYFSEADVERLIASCDLSSEAGKRDRAILLLLARLGLRAGDIVSLRLQDIDWKGAWIHVSGKSRRDARLPLSKEVGRAIVSYLKEGRPKTDSDAVFVRSRAPFCALASHCAVSVLVDRAIQRAGIKRPSRGAAHLLRHSIACSMLRHGASLQDISTLLRHSCIETTQIYAKVDVESLRQIAQPWPEVSRC